MFPWMQWNWKFPLSGDIDQKIEPDLFFGNIVPEAGDSEIEKEVFCKTASYGTQIGLITKILLALVDRGKIGDDEEKALKRLRKISEEVKDIKGRQKNRVRSNMERMMEKLWDEDRKAFEEKYQQLKKKQKVK